MPLLGIPVSAWVYIEHDSTFQRVAERDTAHHCSEKALMPDREHHVSRARAPTSWHIAHMIGARTDTFRDICQSHIICVSLFLQVGASRTPIYADLPRKFSFPCLSN